MRGKIFLLMTAGVLAACATVPQQPATPAPVCSGKAECTAEWAEARTFVLSHAAYKIQTYSRDFLQTFNPSEDSPQLAASVNKQPMPGGRYKIVGSFWCDNIFGCIPDPTTTLNAFNQAVAAAGESDTPTQGAR
jgi:hypothetical protein